MTKSARMAALLSLALILTGCGQVQNASQAANGVAQATRQAGNRVANTVERAGQAADRVGEVVKDSAASFHQANDIAGNLVRSGYAANAIAFVMGDVAYVAVQTPSASGGSKRFSKENIAAHVKSVFPAIRQVYVSESPDVYARFQNFQRLMQQGRPVDAVWQNFKVSVDRMFPS
ncbi:YhcN/YlaJ family sporulation lipoprotein [Alicyclobacillus fructus]|uniref:YhcN/YlaJ family sporulation lipoprotein n=1 Tax=Alicyclobacillus fructus TaxID=2816082 RepID=UPI001A8C2A2C|nr:YhcN/YlaJ family sporulation lipoprotein [Alicyclobacillus fructus]